MAAETIDVVTILFSVLGGIFMGSYPVPVKAAGVLQAGVHPIIFQSYKSFWVFVTGWLFVLANAISGAEYVFAFSWWGIVSAAFWIPCGCCVIAAVPRLGVAMDQAFNTSVAALLSFLVFWLVMGEQLKRHGSGIGDGFYLAPWYLLCIIAGMCALVAAPNACRRRSSVHEAGKESEVRDEEENRSMSQPGQATRQEEVSAGRLLQGLCFSLFAGLFSASQFGVMNTGKQFLRRADGCEDDPATCPALLKEQFNNFGSWMASFGIGAALVTAIFVGGLAVLEKARGRPAPSFHFGAMAGPGTAAGLLWSLGNFFQTAAVARGGNALVMPVNLAIQMVTSGAWGLVYYREIRSPRRMTLWCLAAMWTIAFVILLSREKA